MNHGPLVSVVIARTLAEALTKCDLPVEALLAEVGVSPRALGDTRNVMTVAQLNQLVRLANSRLRTPEVGLRIGAESTAGLWPLLSGLTFAAPSLRSALHLLGRAHVLLVDALEPSLVEREGAAHARFHLPAELSELAARVVSEIFAVVLARVLTDLSRDEHVSFAPPLHEVRFAHPAPPYARCYAEYFGCPVRFGAESLTFVLPEALLDRPRPSALTELFGALHEGCEQLRADLARKNSLTEQAMRLLRRRRDICHVDFHELAFELGLSVRTLRRRLTLEGTTLAKLTDQARMEMATVELLRNGGSIKEAADSLGYSDVTAFHRAFKRCMGKTPAAFIRQEKPDLDGWGPATAPRVA